MVSESNDIVTPVAAEAESMKYYGNEVRQAGIWKIFVCTLGAACLVIVFASCQACRGAAMPTAIWRQEGKDEVSHMKELLDRRSSDSVWAEFMVSNDLFWDGDISTDYYEGAFIGNGKQGAMIMADAQRPDQLRMLMGRYNVVAHYKLPDEYTDPKLFAGSIELGAAGSVTGRTMRLDLWNGEATGTMLTDRGNVQWRAFVDRTHDVTIVAAAGDGGEIPHLAVRPEWGISPNIYREGKNPLDYAAHLPPKPVLSQKKDINVITQKLKSRGAHVVVWQVVAGVLYAAIEADASDDQEAAAGIALKKAVARLEAAVEDGLAACSERHRAWWHDYNRESGLSLPQDPYWQKFWWLQIYKFGSASAGDSPYLIDNEGPWPWNSAWGGVWWNLNVQLSYFPAFTANKLRAGKSLINGVDRIYASGAFHRNASEGVGITVGRSSTYLGEKSDSWAREYGNLTWVLHNYWRYWRYSGDDGIGRKLFPMLADNAEYLMSKLERRDDGRLHMTPSRSPEYPQEDPMQPDTNYGLMALRWALQTLVEMSAQLQLNDGRCDKWQDTLDRLVDYPVDETGLRISANQAYEKSHRHYSHLMAIYPYHTLNPDQGPEARALIRKSVDHWQGLKAALAGYSFTGGCAMYATLGDGEMAIVALDKLKARLQPNTMYKEGGGPVIETPLSGVESINYMLLQSWGGIIRVFPAVPERWRDVRFAGMRTEGGFLVSAVRKDGKADYVRVESTCGGRLRIRPGFTVDGKDTFEVDTAPGQVVELRVSQ